MSRRIVHVDAFTDRPFHGNPAAICLPAAQDRAWPEDAWLSAVAREMNLSETAFLLPADDGWGLRWFTPAVEVDLCGHATLAAAHVLWEEQLVIERGVRFHTRSGVLTAERVGDGIVLDFPARPAVLADPPTGLLEALGVEAPVAVARSRDDWLVQVGTAGEVRALHPDMGRLRGIDTRGVVVTAPAGDDDDVDFVSRWFGPRVGVDEDPVTGSAHCILAPWWAERLGRTELRGFQASARGGTVGVALAGERVRLTGRAVTIMRGELAVP